MKKTILVMGGSLLLFIGATAQAQQKTWDAKKNPTVDSITSPYEGKMLSSRPEATTQDIFPILGKYEASTSSDNSSTLATTAVVVTLDDQNKGLVWIDGLPQGKIKAMLRKSPATYKIPAQQSADGKDVAEGTMVFDKESNTLKILLGKPFNNEDPLNAFVTPDNDNAPPVVTPKVSKTTKKGKKEKSVVAVVQPKPWLFTATKINTATSMK